MERQIIEPLDTRALDLAHALYGHAGRIHAWRAYAIARASQIAIPNLRVVKTDRRHLISPVSGPE